MKGKTEGRKKVMYDMICMYVCIYRMCQIGQVNILYAMEGSSKSNRSPSPMISFNDELCKQIDNISGKLLLKNSGQSRDTLRTNHNFRFLYGRCSQVTAVYVYVYMYI